MELFALTAQMAAVVQLEPPLLSTKLQDLHREKTRGLIIRVLVVAALAEQEEAAALAVLCILRQQPLQQEH